MGDSDGPSEMGASGTDEEPESAPADPATTGFANRRCGDVGTAAPTLGDGHRATANATRGAARTNAASDSTEAAVDLDAIVEGAAAVEGSAATATTGTAANGTG